MLVVYSRLFWGKNNELLADTFKSGIPDVVVQRHVFRGLSSGVSPYCMEGATVGLKLLFTMQLNSLLNR